MKRIIRATEEIFAMSKLTKKYASKSLVGDIGDFIYFSECSSSHSPRVKFYGGTKESRTAQSSPLLSFDTQGNCELVLADWMNKKNCPNAFDEYYVQKIAEFVDKFLPILLLTWFGHIDEADALQYFQGNISFLDLLHESNIYESDILDMNDLHSFAKENNLYQF